MKSFRLPTGFSLITLFSILFLGEASAAPYIVSSVPANGASGVSLSATLTITFSETMNSTLTTVYLFDPSALDFPPATLSWNGPATVLTCTPDAPLPADRMIQWTVTDGQNPAGDPLTGYTGGSFTTALGPQLILTNAAWSAGTFSFDVSAPVGQTCTVEYRSNAASGQWQTLLTTNTTTALFHVVDPHSTTNSQLFYRARTGS